MVAVPLVLLAFTSGGVAAPYAPIPLHAAAPAVTGDDLRWLLTGTVPSSDVARTALLDLRRLRVNGVQVAGWHGPWRYVWPRDASFTAVAYARTGHVADAVALLHFLQRVQGADGAFQARYRPDGTVPDARGLQEDGPGWALWALAAVADMDRTALPALRPLLDRSTHRLLARARPLPPASSDYWERREHRLTLAVAATTLAGLDAAAHVYDLARDHAAADVARAAADRTARAVEWAFGPRYPRYAGDDELDAAVTFLLPPFQRRTIAGADEAVTKAARALRRPGGGLAPGEGWHEDEISWTPETALFALVAATRGEHRAARHWTDWLARHRTRAGSLPEKDRADGSPAAVAPLAWAAALVVLTDAAL